MFCFIVTLINKAQSEEIKKGGGNDYMVALFVSIRITQPLTHRQYSTHRTL